MTNYEPIWQLLEKHQFEIDPNVLYNISCTICHRILIDAYLGPCGCNYCKKCIDSYLKDQGRLCPGNISDCLIEELSLSNNVTKDNGVNRRISKLDVKCPSESCDYHCELMLMSEHLRVCNRRELQCPFHYMGCSTEMAQYQQMSDHLMNEVYRHNKLMVGWMLDMRNEVTSLMTDKMNQDLRTDSNHLEISNSPRMSQLNIESEDDSPITKEVVETLQKEMKDLVNDKNETRRLLREVKDNSARQIMRLKAQIDAQANEIAQMQKVEQQSPKLEKNEKTPPVSPSLIPMQTASKPAESSRRLLKVRRKFGGSSTKNDNIWF